MARRAWLAAAVLALVLAGCGTTVSTTITEVVGPVDASISARDQAFDRDELELPADVPTTLELDNREGAPHNVAIYADDAATQPLFVGEIFGGPATRAYELPPLAAGSYLFRCDVHPDMRGRLTVVPAVAGG